MVEEDAPEGGIREVSLYKGDADLDGVVSSDEIFAQGRGEYVGIQAEDLVVSDGSGGHYHCVGGHSQVVRGWCVRSSNDIG